jgi:hypothetical protein
VLLTKEKDEEIEILKKEKDGFENKLKEKDSIIILYQEKLKEKDLKIKDKKDFIEELKDEILELKEEIAQFKGQLKGKNEIYEKDHECILEMAKQPKNSTTTNNNKILNISTLDLSDKRVKSAIDTKFVKEYIHDGQDGVAKFTVDNLLTDENGKVNYICTDTDRHMFKYKDADGEVRKDFKAKKLTNALINNGIKMKTNEIAPELYTDSEGNINQDRYLLLLKKQAEITGIGINNSTFRNALAAITSNN